MAVLGPRRCSGFALAVVRGLLISAVSCVAGHRLQGTRAPALWHLRSGSRNSLTGNHGCQAVEHQLWSCGTWA